MTLDEAIKHAEEVANANERLCETAHPAMQLSDYGKCAEEHRQLAEWLTGYKKIRESVPVDELRGIIHNLENYDPGLFDIRITEQERDNIVKVLKAVLEG